MGFGYNLDMKKQAWALVAAAVAALLIMAALERRSVRMPVDGQPFVVPAGGPAKPSDFKPDPAAKPDPKVGPDPNSKPDPRVGPDPKAGPDPKLKEK